MTSPNEVLQTTLFRRVKNTPIHTISAIALLMVIFPFYQVYATRSASLFLAAAGIVALIPELIIWKNETRKNWRNFLKTSPVLCAFWLLWAWITASTLWSDLPDKALLSSLTIAGFALCVWVLSRCLARVDRTVLFWTLAIVAIFSGLLLISELSHFTMLHWKGKSQRTHDLNRNLVLMVSMIWPLLLLSEKQRKEIMAIALVFLITTIAVFISHSETAKLALIIATGLFLFLKVFKKLTPAVYLILAASILLTPVAVKSLSHLRPTLQKHNVWTASSRLSIWDGHMKLLAMKPIIGFGAFGDRYAGKQKQIPYIGVTKGRKPGTKYTVHAHGAAVQIWFNFGLIGALLMSALFCAIGFQCRSENPPQSTITAVTITTLFCATVAGASLFQGWALASIAIVVSLLLAAKSLTTSPRTDFS